MSVGYYREFASEEVANRYKPVRPSAELMAAAIQFEASLQQQIIDFNRRWNVQTEINTKHGPFYPYQVRRIDIFFNVLDTPHSGGI